MVESGVDQRLEVDENGIAGEKRNPLFVRLSNEKGGMTEQWGLKIREHRFCSEGLCQIFCNN